MTSAINWLEIITNNNRKSAQYELKLPIFIMERYIFHYSPICVQQNFRNPWHLFLSPPHSFKSPHVFSYSIFCALNFQSSHFSELFSTPTYWRKLGYFPSKDMFQHIAHLSLRKLIINMHDEEKRRCCLISNLKLL